MLKLTNQRISELLTIVLENLKNDDYTDRGICYFIDCLNLNHSFDEVEALSSWFRHQKPRPRMNYQFTKDKNFYGGMWWWYGTKEGKNSRIKFLEYLIKKTSN